jgi:hypothetical protein
MSFANLFFCDFCLGKSKSSKAKQSQAKPSKAKQSQAKPSKAKQSQAKPSKAKQSQAKPSKAKQSQASIQSMVEHNRISASSSLIKSSI